jgi:hypothetical protein
VRSGRTPGHRGNGGPQSLPEAPESDPGDPRRALELTALGTGLVLTLVLMARLSSWSRELGTFQSLYAVAFAFYALALPRAARGGAIPRATWLVLAVAIAGRIALLPVTPTLSDDIYRYAWEGRVAAHGLDPYRLSPGDPALAPLRDPVIHPRVNHSDLSTIYPPLSIAGFALVARISSSLPAIKLWVVLHDLALVALLIAWARRSAGSALPAIAYAWNPLVLIEYAGSGHNDPTSIVWLVAALFWAERRPVASALALAAGVLTKLAPLVALPFLMVRWPWRARWTALAVLIPGLLWFWSETRGANSGLTAYSRTWANNELVAHYLSEAMHDPIRARLASAVLLLTVIVWIVTRRGSADRATRTSLRAGFLLSPVAHPWYLGWVLAFEPSSLSPPWVLLSLTAILSYGVLATPAEGGRFHLSIPWRWFEYGAPLALALVLAVKRARARG